MSISFYSALVRAHLDLWVQFLVLKCKTDMGIVQRVQQNVMKMIKRLEILFCQERLRKLGLFNLDKGSLGGILSIYKYLKEWCKGIRFIPVENMPKWHIIDFQRSNYHLLVCDFDFRIITGGFFCFCLVLDFFTFVCLIKCLFICFGGFLCIVTGF